MSNISATSARGPGIPLTNTGGPSLCSWIGRSWRLSRPICGVVGVRFRPAVAVRHWDRSRSSALQSCCKMSQCLMFGGALGQVSHVMSSCAADRMQPLMPPNFDRKHWPKWYCRLTNVGFHVYTSGVLPQLAG